MEIYLTSKFKKSYTYLPQSVKAKAERKEKIFNENPYHFSLATHRLGGEHKDYWAFSVDRSYSRIMFQFLDAAKKKVVFVNISTHEIYK